MSNDVYKGYKGKAKEKLIEYNVKVWSDAVINTSKGEFAGIILPRSETGDAEHIVIKLHSGYNTGININSITDIKEVGYKEAIYKIPEKAFPFDPKKPNVTLLGTGGTIASRLDYRTGAVFRHLLRANFTARCRNWLISAISKPLNSLASSAKIWDRNNILPLPRPSDRKSKEAPPALSSATARIPCTTPPPYFHLWSKIRRCR